MVSNKMKAKIILAISCIVIQSVYSTSVTLKQGVLNGVELKSRNNQPFYSFSGIPYAKPPVGDLRFKDPEPHSGWSGERDASKEGEACIQDDLFGPVGRDKKIVGNEDCLTLNVYTPKVNPTEKLSVIVTIPGGAFAAGSSSSKFYGAEYFMDKNVVLVVMQFRLGALGFISYGDEEVPGNFGLKDQLLALKWVKENIENFGGDPNSVTLYGQSSGAASAGFHLVSPMSEGLFHKVILESGTQDCIWSTVNADVAKNRATKFAKDLGCPESPSKDSIECLRKITDPNKFIEGERKFFEWQQTPIIRFGPVVESNASSYENKFLPDRPGKLPHQKIPVIIGFNDKEGEFMATPLCVDNFKLGSELNEDFANKVMDTISSREQIPKERQNALIEYVRKNYIGEENSINTNNFGGLSDVITDVMFAFCSYKTGVKHLKYSEQTYFYIYNYKTPLSLKKVIGSCPQAEGVSHGDELPQLFKEKVFNLKMSKDDLKMSNILLDLWTSFAQTGYPKSADLEVEWTPIQSAESAAYLDINNDEIKMQNGKESQWKPRLDKIGELIKLVWPKKEEADEKTNA